MLVWFPEHLKAYTTTVLVHLNETTHFHRLFNYALTFSVCADPLRQVTFNEEFELLLIPTQTYPYGSQPSQFYQYWPAKNNANFPNVIITAAVGLKTTALDNSIH